MSLSNKVQVLVVGTGPTGLAAAIALAKHGVQVSIVDSSSTNPNGSRASVVHARTLEVLDTIGLAQPLIQAGTRCNDVLVRGTTNKLLDFDLTQLRDVTQFPYSVFSPQQIERLFREKLASEGVQLVRNKTIVGLRETDGSPEMEVILRTEASLGRTTWLVQMGGVRRLAGIEFKYPNTGTAYDETSVPPSLQVFLADVYLEDPVPESIFRDKVCLHIDKFRFPKVRGGIGLC